MRHSCIDKHQQLIVILFLVVQNLAGAIDEAQHVKLLFVSNGGGAFELVVLLLFGGLVAIYDGEDSFLGVFEFLNHVENIVNAKISSALGGNFFGNDLHVLWIMIELKNLLIEDLFYVLNCLIGIVQFLFGAGKTLPYFL